MESEQKYVFKFRDKDVELSMYKVQQILTMLGNGVDDAEFAVSLLELWSNEYSAARNIEPTGTLEKQIEQERRQERGDD